MLVDKLGETSDKRQANSALRSCRPQRYCRIWYRLFWGNILEHILEYMDFLLFLPFIVEPTPSFFSTTTTTCANLRLQSLDATKATRPGAAGPWGQGGPEVEVVELEQ